MAAERCTASVIAGCTPPRAIKARHSLIHAQGSGAGVGSPALRERNRPGAKRPPANAVCSFQRLPIKPLTTGGPTHLCGTVTNVRLSWRPPVGSPNRRLRLGAPARRSPLNSVMRPFFPLSLAITWPTLDKTALARDRALSFKATECGSQSLRREAARLVDNFLRLIYQTTHRLCTFFMFSSCMRKTGRYPQICNPPIKSLPSQTSELISL